MNKRTQRIVSISIGLILSILIVVIAFRMLQGRGASAAPNELACTRDGSTATVTWVDGQGGLGTVAYGSDDGANLPFFAQEVESPSSAGIGQYRHSVIIGPLPAGTSYHVAVEGFTDKSIPCTGDDGTAADVTLGTPSNEGLTSLLDDSTVESKAEEEPAEEPADEPEPATEASALPLELATEYYNDNPDNSIGDCVEAFRFEEDADGVRYTGLAATCSAAWTDVNLSD